MEDMREPTAPRQHGRRRLRLWGIVLSLALILGVGAFLGSTLGASRAQASPGASGILSSLAGNEWSRAGEQRAHAVQRQMGLHGHYFCQA